MNLLILSIKLEINECLYIKHLSLYYTPQFMRYTLYGLKTFLLIRFSRRE